MRPTTTLLAMGLGLSLSAPAFAADATVTVTGRVLGPDGKPAANVFVQQQGTFASATTDARGSYTLRLDPTGRQILVFSGAGYLTQEVPATSAQSVVLKPVPTYQPTFTPVPQQATIGVYRLFDTEVGLSYRMRDQLVTYAGRNVSGWANNEIAGSARYRVNNWAIGLNGFRVKAPVSIGALSTQPSPAPSVETAQWNLTGGYVFDLGNVEVLPQLVLSNYYLTPSGSTPWTGTPMDYAQTRQGLGLSVDAGTRMGSFELIAHGMLAPWGSVTASTAPYSLDGLQWGELGAVVGYNVFPGLRADLSYTRQFGSGSNNYGEGANVYGIGFSYHPERVTP
ncbi:MAG TPA: carboxypeptidase regulatory-like domain-containing protein [Stenomitos sp.]